MSAHEIWYLILSFVLGAIPFGVIVFFLTQKKDIRRQGSGNIGATNVWRQGSKMAGVITLILDMMKGIIPVVYGLNHFNQQFLVVLGGLVAMSGHIFSPFLRFKGGKGAATFLGFVIFYNFWAGIIFVVVFLISVAWTRFVSVGSMAGAVAVFFYFLMTTIAEVALAVFVMLILIVIRHRANINRLIQGQENRFVFKKNG